MARVRAQVRVVEAVGARQPSCGILQESGWLQGRLRLDAFSA